MIYGYSRVSTAKQSSVAAGTHRVFWPGVLTVYTNHFTFTPDGGEPVTVTIPAV